MSSATLEEIKWAELEKQFGNNGGFDNNDGFESGAGTTFGEAKSGHEPYAVKLLVGKLTVEDYVHGIEERLLRDMPLSQTEKDLLELAGEDIRDEF